MQLLLSSIVMQIIEIFYGGPVIFAVTYFLVAVVKNWCHLLDHGTLQSTVYMPRVK